MLAYGIYFSLSDLLHSVWQTLGPSTSLQVTQFRFFLWLSNIQLLFLLFFAFEEVEGRNGIKWGRKRHRKKTGGENMRGSNKKAENEHWIWKTRCLKKRTTQPSRVERWRVLQSHARPCQDEEGSQGTQGGKRGDMGLGGVALGGKDAPLLPRARFLADGRKMYRKDYGPFHLAALSSSATLAAGKPFPSLRG